MSLSAVPCRNSRGDDVNDHDLATLRPRAQLLRIGFIVTAILLFACEREPAEARPETMTKAAVEPEPPVAEPKPKPGRRQRVNSRSQALMFEQLQAIGYVDGTYDPNSEQTGVLLNEVGRTSPGYNFYSSRHQRGANLVDMEGKLIHRWRTNQKGAWQHAELLPNGDVVVIVKEERLTRYDADSRVVWSVPGRFHHDLWIRDNEVYVLSREARVVPYVHPRTPTLIDTIEVLSLEDGSRLRKISILDLFHDSPYRFLLPAVSHHQFRGKRIQLDVLHTNHVEVLDGSLSELGPMYAEGNLLISLRNINAIVVFDAEGAVGLGTYERDLSTSPHGARQWPHPTLRQWRETVACHRSRSAYPRDRMAVRAQGRFLLEDPGQQPTAPKWQYPRHGLQYRLRPRGDTPR
jgi:hypothetical protein